MRSMPIFDTQLGTISTPGAVLTILLEIAWQNESTNGKNKIK